MVVLPGPVGAIPVPDVLETHGVPVRYEEVGDLGVPTIGLVVRRAAQDRREPSLDDLAVHGRPVQVGRQANAIAHRHHDVLG